MGLGSGQPSTQTTTQQLSPEQQRLLSLVLPTAEQFVQNPPTLPSFSGVAGFDPAQVQAQQLATNFATGGLGSLAAGAQGANQFLLGPALFPESNPALQQTIAAATRPITENLTQSILPQIRSTAVQSGGFGGTRQGIAEGLASQGALSSIGDISSRIATQGYLAGLQALQGGLQAAPQTAQLGLAPATVLGAVGGQRQAQEQLLLDERTQRFIQEQILPFLAAQEVAGLAFGIPAGTATTRATGGGTTPIQALLGGAALGAGLGFGTGGAAIGGLAGLLLA